MSMKHHVIFRTVIVFFLLIFFSFSALGLEGEGDGGGLNKNEALALVSCNLEDNQKEVPTDVRIHMEFSKNVVNMAVADNNKKSITLTDQKGGSVAIVVQMGDDQVDPTIKRQIDIVPEAPLKQGEKYTLTIDRNFTAKSGSALDAPVVLNFQTAGINSATVNKKHENTEGIKSTGTALEDHQSEAVSTTDHGVISVSHDEQQQPEPDRRINYLLILSVGCIAAAIILFLIYIHRRLI